MLQDSLKEIVLHDDAPGLSAKMFGTASKRTKVSQDRATPEKAGFPFVVPLKTNGPRHDTQMVLQFNREPPSRWLVHMDPHLNDVHQRQCNCNKSTIYNS